MDNAALKEEVAAAPEDETAPAPQEAAPEEEVARSGNSRNQPHRRLQGEDEGAEVRFMSSIKV